MELRISSRHRRKDPMYLGKAILVLVLVYGILFLVKQVLLFFRGGSPRG